MDGRGHEPRPQLPGDHHVVDAPAHVPLAHAGAVATVKRWLMRSAAEREFAVGRALADAGVGAIQVVATDHAPHTAEEKAATDYRKAPSGLPLVQDALLSVLELHHDGELGLERGADMAILSPGDLLNREVVLAGAYYLNAEMAAEEE